MGRHDRPIQGMAWLPHLAPGCGRGLFRGLFCGFMVQDMDRGHGWNEDALCDARITLPVTRLYMVTLPHSFLLLDFVHCNAK